MAKKATDLEDIAEAITGLATQIDQRFEQVDQRFEQVDRRFGGIESELHGIRSEQAKMREWLERIDTRLSGVESDIKEIYDRIVALEKKAPNLTASEYQELEHKLDRLVAWAQKVSAKTGVPLPKL